MALISDAGDEKIPRPLRLAQHGGVLSVVAPGRVAMTEVNIFECVFANSKRKILLIIAGAVHSKESVRPNSIRLHVFRVDMMPRETAFTRRHLQLAIACPGQWDPRQRRRDTSEETALLLTDEGGWKRD